MINIVSAGYTFSARISWYPFYCYDGSTRELRLVLFFFSSVLLRYWTYDWDVFPGRQLSVLGTCYLGFQQGHWLLTFVLAVVEPLTNSLHYVVQCCPFTCWLFLDIYESRWLYLHGLLLIVLLMLSFIHQKGIHLTLFKWCQLAAAYVLYVILWRS